MDELDHWYSGATFSVLHVSAPHALLDRMETLLLVHSSVLLGAD